MQIRLYLDEDAMDSDLVRALRLRGVDVTTALDVGLTTCRSMYARTRRASAGVCG